jgi:hypothetical protein
MFGGFDTSVSVVLVGDEDHVIIRFFLLAPLPSLHRSQPRLFLLILLHCRYLLISHRIYDRMLLNLVGYKI